MDKIVIFGKTQGFESYEIDLLERSEGVKNIYTHPKVLPLENGQFMLHYSFSRETACLSLYTRVINLGSERDGLIFGVAYKTDKNFDLLTVLNNILYPLYRGASTLLLNEDKDKIIHESIVEVLEREIYSQISNWGIKPCVSTSMAESPDSGKIRMLLVSSDKNFQDISNIQSTIKDYSDVYICKYPEVFKSDINSVALRSCKGKITYIEGYPTPPPEPYDIVFKTLISPVESDFDFIVKNTYPLNALRFELIGGRNIAKINGSRLIINPNRENREVENVYIQVSYNGKILKRVSYDIAPRRDDEEYDIVFKTLISPVESDFDFIVKNTYPLNALRFELIGGRNIAKINGSRLIINPNRKNREVENVYIQVSYNGKILKGVSYDIAPRRRRPLPIVLISSVIAVIAISIATLFIIEKPKQPDPTPPVKRDTVKVEDTDRGTLPAPPDLREEKKFVFTIVNKPIEYFMPLVNNQTTYSEGEYYFKVVKGKKYVEILNNKLMVILKERPKENNAEVIIDAYDNKTNKKIGYQKYLIAKANDQLVKSEGGMGGGNAGNGKPLVNGSGQTSPLTIDDIRANYQVKLYPIKGGQSKPSILAQDYNPSINDAFVLKLEVNRNGGQDLKIEASNISWQYDSNIFKEYRIDDKFAIKLQVIKATNQSDQLTIRCLYDGTRVNAVVIGSIESK